MKILIPQEIKSNIENIENVWIEAVDGSTKTSNLVLKENVATFDFVEIPNSLFFKASNLYYKILYSFGEIEFVYFKDKESAVYRGVADAILKCVRKHSKTPYSDTEQGAFICLKDLNEKYLQTLSQEIIPYGKKNLLYYTVYFDKGYVELFHKSLQSILKLSKKNFDVLVITDLPTLHLIQKLPIPKDLNFFLTPTPKDGVEASKNKIKIFHWKNIDNYSNILFLDCDIIAIKNIDTIFNETLKQDTLYTAYNLNLEPEHFKTMYHGFEVLSLDFIEEMKVAKQIPFNAGQFLFKNSNRMRQHFENLLWFMENWPLEYFFEQAFMCYYFAKSYMCDSSVLQNYVSIVSAKDKNLVYQITPQTSLIHFIAPPLNAPTKIKFINNFLKINNLEKNQIKINWFKKLFKLFKKL